MMTREERRRISDAHGARKTYYIIIGLIAVAVIVVLSLTVFFHINEVYVTGDQVPYKAEDIVFASGIESDTNIILASTSDPKERIENKMPYIESVEVIKHFPFKMELKVTSAKIVGQIESTGALLIDRNGKCIDKIDKLKKGIPVIRGAGVISAQIGDKISFGSEKAYENLMLMYKAFSDAKIEGITVYNIGDDKQISATYQNKTVLSFGSSEKLKEKLDCAVKVIEKQKSGSQTGILNLSRVTEDKQYAYFSPEVLPNNLIADVLEQKN